MKTFEHDSCIRYVNLTGSTIYLKRYRQGTIRLEPAGSLEVVTVLRREDSVDGVLFYTASRAEVPGLPDEAGDVVLIVSEPVRLAMRDRYDLASVLLDDVEDTIGLVLNNE